jgi:hypothetical protein
MRLHGAKVGALALGLCLGCATTTRHLATSAGGASPVARETLTAPELGFSLEKPTGEAWVVATDVLSPDGHPIPLVVAHSSGAQVVVQVSEPVDSPARLAGLLHARLSAEPTLKLGPPRSVEVDAGLAASGFGFKAGADARGRVAIIDVGEHVVLVVASWPTNAGERVVHDIDGLVRSVRAAEAPGENEL